MTPVPLSAELSALIDSYTADEVLRSLTETYISIAALGTPSDADAHAITQPGWSRTIDVGPDHMLGVVDAIQRAALRHGLPLSDTVLSAGRYAALNLSPGKPLPARNSNEIRVAIEQLQNLEMRLANRPRAQERVPDPPPPKDGPQDRMEFRWKGAVASLANAPLLWRLCLALWDSAASAPRRQLTQGAVIEDLWGGGLSAKPEDNLKDVVKRLRREFDRAGITLTIETPNSLIWFADKSSP